MLTLAIKMAPQKKKRKIPVSEKKRLAKERGLKSTEKRGKGLWSRKKFTSLPANWRETVVQRGSRKQLQFMSPGKTVYKTQSAVKKALESRGMEECLVEGALSSDSQEEGKTDDSEYLPSDEECKQNLEEDVKEDGKTMRAMKGEEMERRLFVSESTQLMDFVQQINDTCKCSTPNCNGKFSFNTYIPYCNIDNVNVRKTSYILYSCPQTSIFLSIIPSNEVFYLVL